MTNEKRIADLTDEINTLAGLLRNLAADLADLRDKYGDSAQEYRNMAAGNAGRDAAKLHLSADDHQSIAQGVRLAVFIVRDYVTIGNEIEKRVNGCKHPGD